MNKYVLHNLLVLVVLIVKQHYKCLSDIQMQTYSP